MRRGLHDAGLHSTRVASEPKVTKDVGAPRGRYACETTTPDLNTTAQQCVRATQPSSRTPRATVLHGEASPTDSANDPAVQEACFDGWRIIRQHKSGQYLAKQRIRPACSQPAASPPPPPPRFRRRRRDSAARARAPLSPAWLHPSWGCSTHERTATSSLHLIYSCTTTTSPTRHTLTPYPSRELWARLHTT